MKKFGTEVEILDEGSIKITPKAVTLSGVEGPHTSSIPTYEDHRMAMAFATLALKTKEVTIEDPDVVKKSYPDFWNDLKKVGFVIKES